MSSPEKLAAQLVSELIQARPLIAGIPRRFHDDGRESETECIVITGEPGPHETEGPCGYRCPVTILYRYPATTEESRSDMVAGEIRAALEEAQAGDLDVMSQIRGAWLFTEEAEGSVDDTGTVRNRTLALPVLVELP